MEVFERHYDGRATPNVGFAEDMRFLRGIMMAEQHQMSNSPMRECVSGND
jgi:hypothetical protein